jgi:hypothetical protein
VVSSTQEAAYDDIVASWVEETTYKINTATQKAGLYDAFNYMGAIAREDRLEASSITHVVECVVQTGLLRSSIDLVSDDIVASWVEETTYKINTATQKAGLYDAFNYMGDA